ncbi:hypothetical protein RJV68_00610 [Buchnera aphidicola (Neophyllaphis varicolor)]|uniref:hypothetical protein n=1 Tax=Buchnera aphidicola TaxID=9 RepID=UPI0031B83AE0
MLIKILFFIVILFFSNINLFSIQFKDRVIAIVNNEAILQSELNESIYYAKKHLIYLNKKQYNKIQLRNIVIKNLITEHIILQIYQKIKLNFLFYKLNYLLYFMKQIYNFNNVKLNNYIFYNKNFLKCYILYNVLNYQIIKDIEISNQDFLNFVDKNYKNNIKDIEVNFKYILIPISNNITNQELDLKIKLAKDIIYSINHKLNFSIKYSKINNINYYIKNNSKKWESIKNIPILFSREFDNVKSQLAIGPIKSVNELYILKIDGIRFSKKIYFFSEINVNYLKHKLSIFNNKDYLNILNIRHIILKNKKYSFLYNFTDQDEFYNINKKYLTVYNFNLCNSFFKNKIIRLNKNELSYPFRYKNYLYLINFLNFRHVNVNNFFYLHNNYNYLLNQKFNIQLIKWLNKQYKNSYIKILLNDYE